MSQRTRSGWVSVSQWAPTSPPVSSSETNTSFSRRAAGRQPPRASDAAGHRLGGHLRLHVERPAPPQVAVDHLAGPGVVRPLGRVGEHRVDVPEVAEHGTASPRAVRRPQVRHQVRTVLVGRQQLGPEAGVAQISGQELDRGALVARRVDRVEADQLAQDLGGLALELVRWRSCER